ncbi:hypothetical protein Droror1_Dr00004280 [Drosera rotundifolia]
MSSTFPKAMRVGKKDVFIDYIEEQGKGFHHDAISLVGLRNGAQLPRDKAFHPAYADQEKVGKDLEEDGLMLRRPVGENFMCLLYHRLNLSTNTRTRLKYANPSGKNDMEEQDDSNQEGKKEGSLVQASCFKEEVKGRPVGELREF